MVVNDVDMQTSLVEINSHPEERFSGAHANWSYKIVMGQGFLFVCFVLFCFFHSCPPWMDWPGIETALVTTDGSQKTQ